jgi:hypothetical protein
MPGAGPIYHERPINAHPRHGTGPLAHVLIVAFRVKPVETFAAPIARHATTRAR